MFSTRAIHALYPQRKDYMMHFIGLLFLEDFMQGYLKSTNSFQKIKDILTLNVRKSFLEYEAMPMISICMYTQLRPHLKKKNDVKDKKVAKDKKEFQARLTQVGGKKVAASKDFDENTGKLKNDKVVLLDGKKAKKLKEDLEKEDWTVKSVEEKPFQSHPAAPFITSTLQQESNRKLHLSARDTMRIAQRLYEEGLITYMRTDSPNLSSQAIAAARSCVEDLYGKDYLSKTPRQYKSKSKGAQEAHEAIRPAGQTFVIPKESGLTG